MRMRLPWHFVLPRALLTATLAVTLGSFAHVSGGGVMPGILAMANIWLGVFAAASVLVQWRASALQIALPVVLMQGLTHTALSALSGHLEAGQVVFHYGLHDLLGHAFGDPVTLSLHAAAAAVAGLWLGQGEAWLWRRLSGSFADLAEALVRLGSFLAPVLPQPPGVQLAAERLDQRLHPVLLPVRHGRRGPPAFSSR